MYSDIMAACTGYMAVTSIPMELDIKKLVKTEI